MKVSVDLNICTGHAHCQEKCPEVFGTDDSFGKCVIKVADVPAGLEEEVRKAVKSGPEGALTLG